jgi:hypothetical protein
MNRDLRVTSDMLSSGMQVTHKFRDGEGIAYSGTGHFSSAFQKILHIAPTAYRGVNGASSSDAVRTSEKTSPNQ